ncbi:hypothetical protein EYC80_000430 [Monilinia laxa]|uniref:Uncharacterized protein n=1 Tax=Monilinia laxa TaxID=61186 RepID=A0A5N6KAS3_MONLA|nr:hypothetical protein EYC80_000430 [Monilinia laxa]
MTPPCIPAPNTKSDIQWLHEMGYPNGIPDSMTDCGFTTDEQDHLDALNLFRQFRTEHQEAWEKQHHQKPKQPSPIFLISSHLTPFSRRACRFNSSFISANFSQVPLSKSSQQMLSHKTE